MVSVPATLPVTTPDEASMVALVLLLLHVPPSSLLDNVIVLVVQTDVGPEIVPATDNGLTVTTLVTLLVAHIPIIE